MNLQLKLLALAASLAMGSAHAALIDLGASTQVNGLSNSAAGLPLSSSFTVDASVTGEGSAYAFANQNSAYAAGSYATGSLFDSHASASVLHSITNNTGVSQSYSVTFKIYGGFIETGLGNGAVLTAGESLMSSYLATLKLNGSEIFSSGATVTQTEAGISFTKTGYDLFPGGDGNGGYYGWATQYITLDLGVLAAGQSLELLAELGDSALSNVGSYEYDCGDGGYGGYEAAASAMDTCTGFKGYASAFYGDPLETGGEGDEAIVISAVPTGVPEPGVLALAGLGLFAAGWSRRRKTS